MNALPRLYAIADASFGDPVQLAEALFDGGARFVQIRNKPAGSRELLDQVERILESAPADALVIVNDRVDVARISGAGGVHLGQDDLSVNDARRILATDRIIGLSTHNLEQAVAADGVLADYIAVGPVFQTSTKLNADPVLGLESLAAICRAVHKPVVAVGGIKLENVREVLEAGAHSVAVIRDLLNCTDVAVRTREWIQSINAG